MQVMRVRDAVEADAEAMAAIADAPPDVMRNLVHDRTVRVAEEEAAETDPNADANGDDAPNVLGFVSFDADDGTVHVTQLEGTAAACERLLSEPVRFARNEAMTVELLAPETEPQVGEAAESVGFTDTGRGPRFKGTETVRYRLDP
jgi:hypothetical protein